MFWDIVAGVLSGIIGAMGLGGGAVLLIYLSMFKDMKQLNAQGINLLFFIPVALLSVVIYACKKQIKWKTVLPVAAFGLIGAFAGTWLSGKIGDDIVGKLFGVLLALAGVWQIVSAIKASRKQK